MANSKTDSNKWVKPQKFDYFLVLDFEATCKEEGKINPQEIIEFPVLKINSKTLETEAVFQQYVQPHVHSKLTHFCTELTGITQSMIDGQPHIEQVMQDFHQWMMDNDLLNPSVSSVFVTCGDWDLKTMLPHQCQHRRLPVPGYFSQWINIKQTFTEVINTNKKGMMGMLQKLQLPHEGRHHSGIDDCRNIAKILCQLLRRGAVVDVTRS